MFIVVALLISQAPSGAAASHLERGHAYVAELEYESAADEFMGAASDPGATEAQRVEANLYAGICHRILSRDVEARMNFRYVLKNDPDASLPEGTAPKIANFFELVRADMEQGASSTRPEAPTTPNTSGTTGDDGGFPFLGLGAVVAGVGAVMVVFGVLGIAAGEVGLGVDTLSGQLKEGLVYGAAAGAVALVIGAVTFVAGGATAAVGAVLE